ncbi:DVU_1551 family NTP transferase [Sporomusa sp.]|uniref:DVU_1551 family NTP transferase n=1 Tax=Sporomusa sp. TaxID=2078658 RepID=UPI002CB0EE07|nr:NTP transferase domain-containing protein [Sporomusa sp.]HWR41707.1 NTP transferase domain-containing protein [Sporomusa sp.]
MCNSRKIAGLIVAAGYSSRMGAFKPLLPLGGKTVIETAVNSLHHGGVTDVRVVVGHRAEELRPVLKRLNVRIIENPRYAEGMFSSIIAGLKTLAGEAEAFFLLPGDTPLIRRRSIKDMVQAYRKTGATVVYPVFNGHRGHPPLISAGCFESILSSDGAGGLRDILARFTTDTAEVELADQGVLLDIDSIEDYEKLIEFHARREIPTYAECLAMLSQHQVDGKVMRHGQAVAAVGRSMAGLLNRGGLNLDVDLVVAGGLVHDLAKGKPNHPKRGERMVKSMGFPTLSGIVASHMDMELAADYVIDEAAIVFLADKLVQGDRLVSLVERFSPALEKFSGSPEIMDSIARRMRTAEAIRNRMLSLLGISSFDELVLQ